MNVMILGAKPSPAEAPGCRVHQEFLERIGRIEACLERIEKALADAEAEAGDGEGAREGCQSTRPGGTGRSRVQRRSGDAGSHVPPTGGKDELGASPPFITTSSGESATDGEDASTLPPFISGASAKAGARKAAPKETPGTTPPRAKAKTR